MEVHLDAEAFGLEGFEDAEVPIDDAVEVGLVADDLVEFALPGDDALVPGAGEFLGGQVRPIDGRSPTTDSASSFAMPVTIG